MKVVVFIAGLLLLMLLTGSSFAEYLTASEKYELFKKDPVLPVFSSAVFGLGSGQIMIGDSGKGVMFAALDTLIWISLLGAPVTNAEIAALIGSHVLQTAFVYQSVESYNKTLKKKLGIEIGFYNNYPTLGLAYKF